MVVLGDSTALTLGFARATTMPKGTTVSNGGLYGCGLAVHLLTSIDSCVWMTGSRGSRTMCGPSAFRAGCPFLMGEVTSRG